MPTDDPNIRATSGYAAVCSCSLYGGIHAASCPLSQLTGTGPKSYTYHAFKGDEPPRQPIAYDNLIVIELPPNSRIVVKAPEGYALQTGWEKDEYLQVEYYCEPVTTEPEKVDWEEIEKLYGSDSDKELLRAAKAAARTLAGLIPFDNPDAPEEVRRAIEKVGDMATEILEWLKSAIAAAEER